jgi:hypothetical protein
VPYRTLWQEWQKWQRCAIVTTMSKREPSTLGAIAVPSGLALVNTAMTLGAVAGPVGLIAAGGIATTAGVAAAAAKRKQRKQTARKTMAGSAKCPVSKTPKFSKGPASKRGAGKSSGSKSPRKASLGKLASASKGSSKRSTPTKSGKAPTKRGSVFGSSGQATKAKGSGKRGSKSGLGTASRKLARGGKGASKSGARLTPKVGHSRKAAARVRAVAKQAKKSRLFGKAYTALASTRKLWSDRKPKPKPAEAEDAVEKRMRQMAAKPTTKFSEPVLIELPAEAPVVPLPSKTTPASQRKGKTVSHQFTGALEAIEAAFNSFDPENARSVENYYSGIAELSAALSRGLNTGGSRISEDFPIDPAAGEYVTGLGQHMSSLQEHIEEATAAFKNAHFEQLERINSGDSRQVKWDYATNQD